MASKPDDDLILDKKEKQDEEMEEEEEVKEKEKKLTKKEKKKLKKAGAGKTKVEEKQDDKIDHGKEKFTFFFCTANPFSQWHPAEFEVDGITFNCCEQFMMYQKAVLFKDDVMAEEIMKSTEPREQKALGRKVSNFVDSVWKETCRDVVKRGNMAKFSQNAHLKEALLATVGTTLVEASPHDRIWGIGLGASSPKALDRKTWRGSNWLGQALTQVRDELVREEEKRTSSLS